LKKGAGARSVRPVFCRGPGIRALMINCPGLMGDNRVDQRFGARS
jgi:hypothetical protein